MGDLDQAAHVDVHVDVVFAAVRTAVLPAGLFTSNERWDAVHCQVREEAEKARKRLEEQMCPKNPGILALN